MADRVFYFYIIQLWFLKDDTHGLCLCVFIDSFVKLFMLRYKVILTHVDGDGAMVREKEIFFLSTNSDCVFFSPGHYIYHLQTFANCSDTSSI